MFGQQNTQNNTNTNTTNTTTNTNLANNEVAQRVVQEAGHRLQFLKQRIERDLVGYTYDGHQDAQQRNSNEVFNPSVHVDHAKWARARETNPNPRTLTPHLIHGFQQLMERSQMQEKTAEALHKSLEEQHTSFLNLKQHQKTHTLPALRECRDRQAKLQLVLFQVMAHMETYALGTGAARYNYQRQHELEERLSELDKALSAAPGHFSLRVSELSYMSKSLLENLESEHSGRPQPTMSHGDCVKVVAMSQKQYELIEKASEELRKQLENVAMVETAVKRGGIA